MGFNWMQYDIEKLSNSDDEIIATLAQAILDLRVRLERLEE